MKTKKFLLMMMVFFMFVAFSASESIAASVWAVCTIAEAGQSTTTGDVYVKLDEVSDANWTGERYYSCSSEYKNAVLATALTALSGDKQVNVKLFSYNEWSQVQALYCMD